MEMRHIINGCSINLHQLTDRELKKLINDVNHRAIVLKDEQELLEDELIRRTPVPAPLYSVSTDASTSESSVA